MSDHDQTWRANSFDHGYTLRAIDELPVKIKLSMVSSTTDRNKTDFAKERIAKLHLKVTESSICTVVSILVKPQNERTNGCYVIERLARNARSARKRSPLC